MSDRADANQQMITSDLASDVPLPRAMSKSVANREEIVKELLISSVNSETSYIPNTLPELVSIRRSSGLTLKQIADATKISMRYLQAIEDGSLGKLPGGVYTSNYLRQYAEACRNTPPAS